MRINIDTTDLLKQIHPILVTQFVTFQYKQHINARTPKVPTKICSVKTNTKASKYAICISGFIVLHLSVEPLASYRQNISGHLCEEQNSQEMDSTVK